MELQIRDFEFRYQKDDEKPLIRIPQLDFSAGTLSVLHGSSGCGKTTLLGILSLLIETPNLSPGQIVLRGLKAPGLEANQDYSELTAKRVKKLRQNVFGIVLQTSYLLKNLTCRQNLELSCTTSGAEKGRIDQLIELLLDQDDDLRNRLHDYPPNLSVGQRQRVALIRALVANPSVLFADEPTASLDEESEERVLQYCQRWVQSEPDRMAIVVSHKSKVVNSSDCSHHLPSLQNG